MCPNCQDPKAQIIKRGFFARQTGHSPRIQRYLCKSCKRGFCDQTGKLTYRERKSHLTLPLMRLLVIGVSQRAAALALDIHPITVARKLCRLGARAKLRLAEAENRADIGPVVVFDEMETFEHSKCKPLAIALAVEEGSRRVIAAEVARMPAKGKLAAVARKRYGRRVDERSTAIAAVLGSVRQASPNLSLIKSDLCPRYPSLVQDCWSQGVHHVRFRGRRGCVVGQGELKAGGFDPLFSLNHTCAMFRDRIKRLSRRTWCTTKRVDRLQMLVHLYAWCHNQKLDGRKRLLSLA